MIISCTVRVISYDNRNNPATVWTYMCITQDTFIDIVMSWYDHYCADANILILSYLPCWSYILSTIAFILWKSFVCKFVLVMWNVFILVHNDLYGCFVICYVFYCIICCICIFYHELYQKWQKNLWNQSIVIRYDVAVKNNKQKLYLDIYVCMCPTPITFCHLHTCIPYNRNML